MSISDQIIKGTYNKSNSNSISNSIINGTYSDYLKKKREEEEKKRISEREKTSSNNKQEDDRKWFQKGAFEDGYQFGDITKTILSTGADAGQDFGKGILGIGEGVIDTGAYLIGLNAKGASNTLSKIQNLGIFNEEQKEMLRKSKIGEMTVKANDVSNNMKEFMKRDLVEESKIANMGANTGLFGGLLNIINGEPEKITDIESMKNVDSIERGSVLGDKSDALVQSAGQLVGTVGLQAVGVPWWVTTGTTSFGGGTEEAFQNEATYGEAGIYGLINAGADILTEKLSGGISFGGKTLDDTLLKPLTSKISNKTLKILADFGIDAIGEGNEEVIASVMQNMGKKLTYEDEKTWNEILTSEEAMDEYLESYLGGMILGGGANVGKVATSIQNKAVNNELQQNTDNTIEQNNIDTNIENKQGQINTEEVLPTVNEQNLYENRTREKRLNELKKIDTSDMGLIERSKIKKEIRALELGYNSIEEYEQAEKNKIAKAKEEYEQKKLSKNQEKQNQESENKSDSFNLVENYKQKQLEIIKKSNPANDDYHTWIRKIDDIKTYEEAFFEDGEFSGLDPDFTEDMASNAKKIGKITVYSSYPIENGIFVSPSQMEASQYAGGDTSKLYSKEVNLEDVAWIDGAEGQYAKVENNEKTSEKSYIINEKVEKYINKNKENFDTDISIDTNVLNTPDNLITNYKNAKETVLYNKARKLFSNIHKRVFKNNNQSIYVTNADINESIHKTMTNPQQKELIKENLAVFSQLDKIIENGELISSEKIDNKGRNEYSDYEYYVSKAIIDGQPYIVEFDTRMQQGTSGRLERHFRLERVYKINETDLVSGTDNSMSHFGPKSVSINNSISQNNNNMQVQDKNVVPSVENNILPTARKQTMNPTEISELKLDDARTTPKLPQRKYKEGNKQSSFLSNIITDSKFLNEDLRQQMGKEDNIRYYQGITNEKTLENAYNKLQKDGQSEVIKWHSKDSKNANAEDVAEGWILLKQYQDSGDYQSAVEVAKKMRDIGTTAGQTVQAYNILSRLTPEGMFYYAQSELNEAYNKMVDGKSKKWIEENQSKFDLTPEETQNILDIMKDVSTMEDGYNKKVKLAEVQKIITNKIPPTAGQSIKAWMRISMLFNPKTQVRNVMGNAVILPVNMFSDSVSAGIDKLIAKKTGVRTTGNTNLKNYGKGFGKGLYESYNDFRKGINTRNIQGNRFEVSQGKNFNDKGIGKALNRVDNLLSFMLDAGDRGFYEATFTNSLNNQMVLNNVATPTQEMIDIATNEALQRTWQDNNKYTQSVLKIRNILNNVNVKGYGLGDVIIPFAKTPANLTKAIVDYSPAGLVKTLTMDARKFKNSLQNGQYSPQLQHQFVQNLGKATAGTFLYVLSYGLAKAGIATGEADEDKDVKNFMKNSLGISSYSIKIGDKTFSYDWAQPIATPLAIMTNYVKYSEENPDANIIEKGINAMNIGTEQLLQQSFMESLNTVLNGNGTTLENLSQAVLELPARAVPTFFKQIADMVDSTQRTTFEYDKPVQSAINSVVAKIPFASRTLPASVDTLGNEIQKYGGNNNVWNVMLNPANTNKGTLSKAGQEIYNVYKETGDTTIFPRTAPYYINSKGEKITMTSEQRSKFQTVTGKYVESSLSSLLNDKDYKKLSNEEKANIINEIVSDSYSKAKYDVLKIDSEEYKKLRTTLENVKPSTYYNYKLKTKDLKKDNEKISVLIDSSYTNKEKTALYETYILSSTDKQYPIIKEAFTDNGLNIQKYLEYKNQEFSADKEDDGTVDGKTISGSKKTKVWNYIENMNISYTQKLLLYGLEYTPSDSQQKQILNYVKSLPNKTNKEKLEILSQFKGFTIYKDGTVGY